MVKVIKDIIEKSGICEVSFRGTQAGGNIYSSPQERERVMNKMVANSTEDSRLMTVSDMDGNILIGWNPVEDEQIKKESGGKKTHGLSIDTTVDPERDAASRNLPERLQRLSDSVMKRYGFELLKDRDYVQNLSFRANIADLNAKGLIKEGIFAKNLDVRLPEKLVVLIKKDIAAAEAGDVSRLFDHCLLTSRSKEDAMRILWASGFEDPTKVTMVADSGATLFFNGQEESVVTLPEKEQEILKTLHTKQFEHDCEEAVYEVINLQQLYDDKYRPENTAKLPKLLFQDKKASRNVDWRTILTFFNEPDEGALDKELGAAIKKVAERYLEEQNFKIDVDGKQMDAFKVKPAPTTLEIISNRVHKGVGLHKLYDKAKELRYQPSALLYTGDDICKVSKSRIGSPTCVPSTDYDAFIEGRKIEQEVKKTDNKSRFKFYGLHTLHPVKNDINGTQPSPERIYNGVMTDKATQNDRPFRLDMITRTPIETGDILVELAARQEQRLRGEVAAGAGQGR